MSETAAQRSSELSLGVPSTSQTELGPQLGPPAAAQDWPAATNAAQTPWPLFEDDGTLHQPLMHSKFCEQAPPTATSGVVNDSQPGIPTTWLVTFRLAHSEVWIVIRQ